MFQSQPHNFSTTFPGPQHLRRTWNQQITPSKAKLHYVVLILCLILGSKALSFGLRLSGNSSSMKGERRPPKNAFMAKASRKESADGECRERRPILSRLAKKIGDPEVSVAPAGRVLVLVIVIFAVFSTLNSPGVDRTPNFFNFILFVIKNKETFLMVSTPKMSTFILAFSQVSVCLKSRY